MIYIPNLHITYRNLSDTNYYFLKMSDSRDSLPETLRGGLIHPGDFEEYLLWRHDYYRRAKSHGNYANENFHVRIGREPLFSSGWKVIHDSLLQATEYMLDRVNDNLADIYEYMYRSNNSEYKIKRIYFTPSDLTPENILNVVNDQFVFLKPNEIYIDTYNLVGFKKVEGCFTFLINQSSFKDYVLIEPKWNDSLSRWEEQRMCLPDKIGEYQLYSGDFLTNRVMVDFSKSIMDK